MQIIHVTHVSIVDCQPSWCTLTRDKKLEIGEVPKPALCIGGRAQEELKQLQSLKPHGIEVSVPSDRVQIRQTVVPGPDESPEEKWTQLQSLKRYGIEVSVPSDSLQIWEAIAPGPGESPEDPPSSSDITIHHDDPHPVNFRVTPTLQTQNGKVRCKKSRTVFTDLQLRVLEKTFSEQKYLDSTNRDKLAHILGLNQAQVKTWFQNRRMKWKRNAVAKADKPDSSSTVLLTDLQLRVLEKTFSEQRYLESTDRAKLAHILGLKEGQVKTWFQNRRMKAASKADKPDSFSTEENRENGQSGEKNDKETGTQGRDRLDHE